MRVGLTPVQASALGAPIRREVNLKPCLITDKSFLVTGVRPPTKMLSVGVVGDDWERAHTTDIHVRSLASLF